MTPPPPEIIVNPKDVEVGLRREQSSSPPEDSTCCLLLIRTDRGAGAGAGAAEEQQLDEGA